MIIIIDSDTITTINSDGWFYMRDRYGREDDIYSELCFGVRRPKDIVIASGSGEMIDKIFTHIVETMKGWSWPNIVIDISTIV